MICRQTEVWPTVGLPRHRYFIGLPFQQHGNTLLIFFLFRETVPPSLRSGFQIFNLRMTQAESQDRDKGHIQRIIGVRTPW